MAISIRLERERVSCMASLSSFLTKAGAIEIVTACLCFGSGNFLEGITGSFVVTLIIS